MSRGRYFLRKGSSCIADCACCCNVFQRLLKLGRYELNLWIFMHAFVYSSHYWNWIIQSPSALCRTFQRGRGHLVQYYKKYSLFTGHMLDKDSFQLSAGEETALLLLCDELRCFYPHPLQRDTVGYSTGRLTLLVLAQQKGLLSAFSTQQKY